MKKILLLLAVLLGNVAMSSAQNAVISMIGAGISDWNTDVEMSTVDGVTYTLEFQDFVGGPVKFRQDAAWTNNWGGTGLSGVAVFNSNNNISVPAGTYDVTFNIQTLAYSIVPPAGAPALVTLRGAAAGQFSIAMAAEEGSKNYMAKGIVLVDGELMATVVDGAVTTMWGGTTFPQGVASQEVAAFPVTAGTYDISLNIETGVYSFAASTTPTAKIISLIGNGIVDWNTDTALTTTDGVNYMLMDQVLLDGFMKFRYDNKWDISWGGDGPDGNIVTVAGTYDIAINVYTGVYTITDKNLSAGDEQNFVSSDFSVVNPSSNGTLELSVAADVTVYDLSGRLVAQSANTASVDVSALAKGSYIVKTSNGVAKQFSIK